MPETPAIIDYILSDSNDEPGHIDTRDELRDALYFRDERLFDALSGEQLTQVATALTWDDYKFEPKTEHAHRPRATVLEEVNTKTLAVLAPDGVVYHIGDVIRFEGKRPGYGWGSRTSHEKTTIEGQIAYLSENTASIGRMPTYSNVPSKSPTAYFGRSEIERLSKSDLRDYRDHYTEGPDVDIPETVNGWELVETKVFDDDTGILPTNLVTKMQWCNGEDTYITAQWRGSYNCWYLSVPCEGILTDDNVDEYLYEIDVPQAVVRTETVLALAAEAMRELDPADFEAPYDLRLPKNIDEPASLHAGPAPITLPDHVGDWEVEERRKRRVKWRNDNPQSAWYSFTLKIDFHGGVLVWNGADEEAHERRPIKKHFPNGEPHPDNVEENYGWRRREMFEDNWMYGIAFMVQTSRTAVDEDTLADLDGALPEGQQLETFDHSLDMDPQKTMDRENGTLLAYGQGTQPTRSST